MQTFFQNGDEQINNSGKSCVAALVFGMPSDQLIKAVLKNPKGISPEAARMGQEMEMLGREFKAEEKGCRENMLHLTLARAFIRKLLENVNGVNFLQSCHGDVHAEFVKIAITEALQSDNGSPTHRFVRRVP